jgi:hypothetical protein
VLTFDPMWLNLFFMKKLMLVLGVVLFYSSPAGALPPGGGGSGTCQKCQKFSTHGGQIASCASGYLFGNWGCEEVFDHNGNSTCLMGPPCPAPFPALIL